MASIYPKDFFEKTNNKYQKGSCFVLMPFDQKYQDVYKKYVISFFNRKGIKFKINQLVIFIY